MRQKLRKRGQLTPRDTTVSVTAGVHQPEAQGSAEERPASLINFKLDQAQPDPERRCEATWQLKRPIQDLPAKLTQLFKRRQWVPSKETRKPRMNDVVLIQQGTEQQKQAIGKAGRIVQDDSSKDGQRFRVKLVEGEDPFGEIQGELQELRSKIFEAKRAIGAASRDEKPALEAEHQQLLDKQSSLQGPVPGHFKPSDLMLLDEEHASHFALAGPNSHCVASIVVDYRGEDSDGSFTQACAELKKAAPATADDAQRLKAQNNFLLSVVRLSTFWMPFDAAAFTREADAAEEEVVAAETKLLRAFETDVTVFPPAGQYAATVLTLGEVGLTLELRFKRCLLCRADVFTKSSQPFVAPSGMLASNPDQGSSQSSWEAAAPASGGYASLDYGDHDHPCYQREGCGTCVHRLRFDNSEIASAVYVEVRERERKKPADAYRASTGAEPPSDPSQLPPGQLTMTHARLLTGADTRAAPGFPSGAVVYYEVRLRSPGHEAHILPLDEQVDHPAGTRLLFQHGQRLVDGSVEQRVRARRFEVQLASPSSQPHSAGPAPTTTTTTIQVDLNGMNHCEQRFRDAAEYESERVAHCEKLAASLELVEDAILTLTLTLILTPTLAPTRTPTLTPTLTQVEDAITGKKLKIREQLLYIDLALTSAGSTTSAEITTSASKASASKTSATSATPLTSASKTWDGIGQAKDIAHRLLASSVRHRLGAVDPPPVLVCAGPGTGKTWSALQLAHELAVLSGGPTSTADFGAFAPVPLLIFVQRLSRHVRTAQQQGKPVGKDDLLRLYIEAEFSQQDPRRELMLKQASSKW